MARKSRVCAEAYNGTPHKLPLIILHVWTVDRPAAAERLSALGVDSIMTNRPGWLRQRLEGYRTP